MITDKQLEKLIQPIIIRQEQLNMYVINVMVARINEIGNMLPSDIYKLQRLFKSGADIRSINKKIAEITGLQEKHIKRLIRTVAEDAYLDSKPLYDYRRLSFIPFEENTELQKIVRSIQKQTVDTYINLSKAQAFMIRDRRTNKLKPTTLSKTYYEVVDRAIQATQSGAIDYNTAMRDTIRELVDSGVKTVSYDTPTGKPYCQRLDTAVKRNILDGIRAINQGIQDEIGNQFGADGKEITVHANSAPDHEPIQGHQFSNEEYDKLQNQQPFKDSEGNEFSAIDRPIGVWNCRHFTYSIVLGVSKPVYTIEQLDKLKENNAKGFTDSKGRHYTLYECSQHQRELETKIRRAKEEQIAMRTNNDISEAKKCQFKVNRLENEYSIFSKKCGLSRKFENLYVENYKKLV